MNNINPLKVSDAIKETYARYLESLLRPSDERIAAELARVIADSKTGESGLLKGPFLEAQPPYVKDVSIRDLVSEGILDEGFLSFDPSALPIDRALYSHQVRAIRRVTDGKSVVVATGTGSGKTESFLLPIINELLRQRSQNLLGPGVRALLLYPMNALANDQVKRLRRVLSSTPHITFGRYTGETPNSYQEARAKYLADFGEEPLPNELISREQMQATPPHILLTNFAMLEYLLLRPKDSSLFDGASGRSWRFIVADEAHTYDGAHGVEVANLISKLRQRVDPQRIIQTIGTTATIGKNKLDIRSFASSFFGNDFEIGEDASPDLIEPIREELQSPSWGPLTPSAWMRIVESADSLATISEINGMTDFEACQAEASVTLLRKLLMEGPAQFHDAAESVFPEYDAETARAGLLALLNVATRTTNEDGEPAVSARFHLFARATEGIFTCLNTSPHMTLSRHLECPECEGKAFELGACRKCGGAYIIGALEERAGQHFISQSRGVSDSRSDVLLSPIVLEAEDEDSDLDIRDGDVDLDISNGEQVYVCRSCGYLDQRSFESCLACSSHDVSEWILKHGSVEQVGKCRQCNSIAPQIIRRLASGSDAAAAVLATELYTHLPEDPTGGPHGKPGGGRKLMVFSDSRQQAAFFAPYLQNTHERILWRQLILAALRGRDSTKLPGTALRLADIESQLVELAIRGNLLSENQGANAAQKSALERMHWEAISTDRQMNLEGTGFISWQIALPENESAYQGLMNLGLSFEQSKHLLQQLLSTLREGGILTHHSAITDAGDLFAPRRGPRYIRGAGADATAKIHAWSPDRLAKATNSRLDYISKVFQKLNIGNEAVAQDSLARIWDLLGSSAFEGILQKDNSRSGPLWRINYERLEIHLVQNETPLWVCSLCGRTTYFNVANVCGRFRCQGSLAVTSTNQKVINQHYRALYGATHPMGLVAAEHTAQLDSDTASEIQQKFIAGDVNVLSSSTTFELGVDVGELQSVLLRNMPPSTANYLQRAGRAGRRSDSAALILTYAQRRPHDMAQYANPVRMISGEMRAPFVNLENARIFMRHMYSVFFAAYWRTRPADFDTAGALFLRQADSEVSVIERIVSWVVDEQDDLRRSFDWLLPTELESSRDLIWSEILTNFARLSTSVADAFEREIHEYDDLIKHHHDEAYNQSGNKRRHHEITRDRLEKAKRALTERDIIGFLSSRNLLPKYGFPVDTVNLIPRMTDEGAKSIDMSRDLTLAIFEYAPGNQLIANGQLWESVGLEVQPGKELERFSYAICADCRNLHKQLADHSDFPTNCRNCGSGLNPPSIFVNPKWGFIANASKQKIGETLKSRTWRRNIVLAEPGALDPETTVETPNSKVNASLQNIARVLILNESSYSVCQTCHYAEVSNVGNRGKQGLTHDRPKQDGKTCEGFLKHGIRFGHEYETDLVRIEIDLTGSLLDTKEVADSTENALVQAAADLLQIAQGDLDVVSANRTATSFSFAIVDAVPAGAGFAKLVAKNVESIFHRALSLVADCECGEETSCYECLRNYSNQRLHETLSRGQAKAALEFVLNG